MLSSRVTVDVALAGCLLHQMGKSYSKILSLDKAKERVGAADWDRYSRGFDKIASPEGQMSFGVFNEFVLGSNVPRELADRMFLVIGQRKKFIEKNEFLCGMAIFANGTPDERVQFVFHVFDADSSGAISRDELSAMGRALRTIITTPKGDPASVIDVHEILKQTFEAVDQDKDTLLSLPEFKAWALKNLTAGILQWIMDFKPKLPLDINEQEITDLEKQYFKMQTATATAADIAASPATPAAGAAAKPAVAATAAAGTPKAAGGSPAIGVRSKVTKEALSRVFSSVMPADVLARIFTAFDTDANGTIEMREFITGLSSCCRGTKEERMRFCFKAFDDDGDGKLSKAELYHMIASLWKIGAVHDVLSANNSSSGSGSRPSSAAPASGSRDMLIEPVILTPASSDDKQPQPLQPQPLASSSDAASAVAPAAGGAAVPTATGAPGGPPPASGSVEDKEAADVADSLHRMVDGIFAKYDTNQNGLIEFVEFMQWSEHTPIALAFFSKIREFTSIHLGLQPTDPEEEKSMILNYLKEQSRDGLKEQITYFVLSAKWRNAWCKFVDVPASVFQGVDIAPDQSDEKTRKSPVLSTSSRAKPAAAAATGGDKYKPESKSPTVTAADIKLQDSKTNEPSTVSSMVTPLNRLSLRPGEIDNSDIVIDDQHNQHTLKPNLTEGVDFSVVSEAVWTPLFNWYGGGPAIPRQVIRVGPTNSPPQPAAAAAAAATATATAPATATATAADAKSAPPLASAKSSGQKMVELYPLVVKCKFAARRELIVTVSRTATLTQLQTKICTLSGIEPLNRARLWDIFDANEPKLLDREMMHTLEEAQFVSGQSVYVEIQLENSRWPGYDGRGDEKAESSASKDKVIKSYDNGGLCGLYNLGNTCFMNSALQCLSATRPLTDYFLSDMYIREVNLDNPLGMQGKVALEYGIMLKKMWSTRPHDALAPRGMKAVIGKFAPQFVGYQQQDAQELAAFVLDGLHEGLNRILKKPYVPIPDSNNRPDAIVAAEHWAAYQKRNSSVITDLFTGQLKSTVTFACGTATSVTFDPYTSLSLPLPNPPHRFIEVVVAFHQPSRPPIRYSVEVTNERSVRDLKETVSRMCHLPTTKFQMAEVYNHLIHQWIRSNAPLSEIGPLDVLYAFEIPAKHEIDPDVLPPEPVKAVAPAPVLPPAPVIDWHNPKEGMKYDVCDTSKKWLCGIILQVGYMQIPPPTPAPAPAAAPATTTTPPTAATATTPATPTATTTPASAPATSATTPTATATTTAPAVVPTPAAVATLSPPAALLSSVPPLDAATAPPLAALLPPSTAAVTPAATTTPPTSATATIPAPAPAATATASTPTATTPATAAPAAKPTGTATAGKPGNMQTNSTPAAATTAPVPAAPQNPITLTPPSTSSLPAGTRVQKVVLVHYDGWASRWDEWIPFPSYRVAPAGTHVIQWTGSSAAGLANRNDDLDVDQNAVTIHALHRKLEPLVEEHFFHPVRPVLFHVPELLYVLPKKCTYAKLYELIWEKARRYATLPRSAVANVDHPMHPKKLGDAGALSPQQSSFADLLGAATAAGSSGGAPPATPVKSGTSKPEPATPASVTGVVLTEHGSPAAGGHASAMSLDSKSALHRPSLFRQMSADGKEGVFPPFVLKRVNRAGTACSRCTWIKMCLGCMIDFTNEPIQDLGDNSFIAIDWNPLFLSTYFKQKEMNEIWDDESVTTHRQIANRPISFADCMAGFTTKEVLDGDSRPRCPKCKAPEKAVKGLELWNTPPVLVIHLKRLLPGRKLFTTDEKGATTDTAAPAATTTGAGDPLVNGGAATAGSEQKVAPPLTNGAAPAPTAAAAAAAAAAAPVASTITKGNNVYDLYGVVNHFGASMGGHYVTYALSNRDGRWYSFNDSYVTPIQESDVIGPSAYMLFYQKRGLPAALGFLPDVIQKAAKEPLKEEHKKLLAQSSDEICCPNCTIM